MKNLLNPKNQIPFEELGNRSWGTKVVVHRGCHKPLTNDPAYIVDSGDLKISPVVMCDGCGRLVSPEAAKLLRRYGPSVEINETRRLFNMHLGD